MFMSGVQMLTANRTEFSYTLDLLKESKVVRCDGRHGTLLDSQHPHPKMDTTAESGVLMDEI